MKIYLNIFFLLIAFKTANAQFDSLRIGGGIGFGSLLGDFPSQSTLGAKIFLETDNAFSPFDKLQFHFAYAQKIEKFLPGDYKIQYYSYMYSIGLTGLFTQKFNKFISVDEGIGLLLLNDRSFDDIDVWNYGVSLNVLGEIKLNNKVNMGLGLDYGLTFNNTNMSYFLIFIQVKHSI